MDPDEVVHALAASRYDDISEASDASFRRAVPTAEISRVWNSAIDQFGPLTAVEPGVVLHDLALQFEHGAAHLQVAYRGGRIVGLVLKPGDPTGRFGQ